MKSIKNVEHLLCSKCPSLFSRYLGFVGCIGDFEVDNDKPLFDLTTLDVIGPDKSKESCYNLAQPGLGFNGSSWARFGK